MKEIALDNSDLKAQVDDEDFEFLNRFRWKLQENTNNKYAVTSIIEAKIMMHRLIMGSNPRPKSNLLVDHKDRNGLNNIKTNLRWACKQKNGWNADKRANCISKYKGVTKAHGTKWKARCKIGIKEYTKLFNTELEAAIGYDLIAAEYYGEYAVLNFPK